jgi:hypothetical protein
MRRNLLQSILALAVALLLLGSPAPAADGKAPLQKGTLHVLAVGVARAENGSKEGVLPGADQNARNVAAFFKGQEGKLYAEVRAGTLINEQATHANILAELECLQYEFRPGDTAVVHLSGHGAERRGQWRMAAHDYAWSFWSVANSVTAQELRARLEKLPGRVILILDSCHSGAFGDGVSNRAVRGEAGLVVYAAAMHDQFGYYIMNRGLFTAVLLEGLSGSADANGDGVVTLAELDAYVSSRIAALTEFSAEDRETLKKRGVPAVQQTPTLSKPASISGTMPLAVVLPAEPDDDDEP